MKLGCLIANVYLRIFFADLTPVIQLLSFKNINTAILVNCFSTKYEVYTISKQFQNYGIGCSFLNIEPKNKYEFPCAYSKVGIFLNTSCKGWEHVFASNASINKHELVWVLFTKNFSNVINILTKYPIEIDSDITIITKIGGKYFLYEIYNTGFYNQGSFVVRNIGVWNNELYINKTVNRNNFQGVVLKCGVVLMEKVKDKMSEHYLTVTSRDKVDPLHRFKYFKMLSHLEDLLNFSCILVRTNSWGYQRNTSFDGLVGVLQRREADIGGAPVFYRRERAEVVDYTAQIWPSRVIGTRKTFYSPLLYPKLLISTNTKELFMPYIILRQPKYSGNFYSVYTRPLSKTVWTCTFAVLTLFGIMLSVLLKMKCLNAAGDEQDTSSSLSLLFIFGAVSQQGMPVNKKSTSVKMVIFVTFIFTLTLYQYYNATVVSTLLRVPPKVIDSVLDLIKSDMKAGVDDALYNRDFFVRTTDPLARELHDKKIVHGTQSNYFTPEQGMALVKKGGFAFLVDTATAYRIMRKTFTEPEVCDATQVSLYPPQSMGSVAKKGTPYKEFLAIGTAKMLESGVMYRLKTMWDEPRPPCVRTPDTSVFSVNIYEFSMALFILLLGMLISVFVLFTELLAKRFLTEVRCVRTRKRKVVQRRH